MRCICLCLGGVWQEFERSVIRVCEAGGELAGRGGKLLLHSQYSSLSRHGGRRQTALHTKPALQCRLGWN